MEQELLTREEKSLQASGFIEQAVCHVYEEYPYVVKMILFTAVSLIFGYSAYKEYEIARTVGEERA